MQFPLDGDLDGRILLLDGQSVFEVDVLAGADRASDAFTSARVVSGQREGHLLAEDQSVDFGGEFLRGSGWWSRLELVCKKKMRRTGFEVDSDSRRASAVQNAHRSGARSDVHAGDRSARAS